MLSCEQQTYGYYNPSVFERPAYIKNIDWLFASYKNAAQQTAAIMRRTSGQSDIVVSVLYKSEINNAKEKNVASKQRKK